MHDWTDEVVTNGLIFVAFFSACTLHHWIQHRKEPKAQQTIHHALWAAIFNPATIDTVKDFVVHMLVYSGYVIPPH